MKENIKITKHIADSALAGKNCSICLDLIIAGDEIVSCPFCGLPFHSECWEENRGCSAYGCKGVPDAGEKSSPVTELSVAHVWGETKECPNCGEKIKSQALKCRYCGEIFHTRDAISTMEFEQREYEGDEAARIRNIIFLLFFLSATGCLSIFILAILSFLIFGGSLGSIKFRRLSPAMKAVCYVAFGVNVFLLILLVLLVVFD